MHTIDIKEKRCFKCEKHKKIVYIEVYLTSEGPIGINHCRECANKKTKELINGKCLVVHKK